MARFLYGAVKIAVFRVDKAREDFKAIVRKFKVTDLDVEKPQMRFYPNDLEGEAKSQAS